MKTIFAVSFIALAYVNAFMPIQPSHRALSPSKHMKTAIFMSSVLEETKTIDESKAVVGADVGKETLSLVDVNANQTVASDVSVENRKELSETQKLMQQVKDAGVAGIVSYAFWEIGFWAISVPVCIAGYREVTGHWPDFSNSDDVSKLGAEAFAFVNFARFAVPLRIGLALSTTPWIQKNIIDRFSGKENNNNDIVTNNDN